MSQAQWWFSPISKESDAFLLGHLPQRLQQGDARRAPVAPVMATINLMFTS